MSPPPNSNLVGWRSLGALAAVAWLIGIVIYYAVLAGRYGEWPQWRNLPELIYVTGQTLATWAALAWFLAQWVSLMARKLPARVQIWFIPASAVLLSTLPAMIVTAGGFPAGFVLLPLALVAGMINPDSLLAFGHPLKLFLQHEAQLLLFCFMGIALFFSLGYSWRVAPQALHRRQRTLQASIAVALVLGAIFTAPPLTIAITDDQKINLLVFQWIEKGEGFFIEPYSGEVLSDVERTMLKNLGLRGTLRMTNGRNTFGRGAPVTMMIVMHEPLTQPVRLPQPHRRNVVYLQRGGGFEMYPAQAPRLERVIELSADKHYPEITMATIDMSLQGRTQIPVLTFKGGTSE